MGDYYHNDVHCYCQLCDKETTGAWSTYFYRPYTVALLCDECHARFKARTLTDDEVEFLQHLCDEADHGYEHACGVDA